MNTELAAAAATFAKGQRRMDYQNFLAAKVLRAQPVGFEPRHGIGTSLFPFQRQVVMWALRMGRAAVFMDCGMGKTAVQLEWAHQVAEHTKRPVLILAPLAVTAQTVREGEKFGIPVKVLRSADDEHGMVNVANYEVLHKLDPTAYDGVVLDESSILKAFSGKTKRALVDAFAATPYKLACTATPAPNDPMELGNHSEFLGVMTSHKMLARWFINDTMQAGVWRLKGHAERDFWRWVTSWAVCASKPSDLGEYSDDGYVLPPLELRQHTVTVDIVDGRDEGRLFRDPTLSATTLHKELRRTAPERSKRVAELVASTPGPWVVWCNTNYEADELAQFIPEAVEIRGDDTVDQKEQRVADFVAGRTRVLLSKPSILGFGLNFQHVAKMAFVGLSYSYEQFYQALRRAYRFGQKSPVTAHIVAASTEGAIVDVVRGKKEEHEAMKAAMVDAMRLHGIRAGEAQATALDYVSQRCTGPGWDTRLGDSVDLIREVPDETLDLCVYSPPFSNLYTYSDSYRDMGNSADDAEFLQHYDFLLGQMLRATKSGRLMAVHVKQCVNYKGRDGASGLRDFRGEVIRAVENAVDDTNKSAGWVYHSEVCIWKCPVTEMQRTKSHGLLYKQLRKDSSYSRQGLAEYLLVFRKWSDKGDAEPVTKTEDEFPLELWQRYASPVWMDINQMNVLNVQAARDSEDEKHICPLQLDVIERAVRLWSNPGDLVFSPFAGIGSEGYVALKEGRRFLGFELKESYYRQACKNLQRAVAEKDAQGELFALPTGASGAFAEESEAANG
jgi:DNA modification methylase/superfamily II DNA or RNA helicase